MQLPKKQKIIAVHLFNDYSGSPLVFKQAIVGLLENDCEVILHTAANHEGFLSKIKVKKKYFQYVFFQNSLIRLFAFLISQIQLFFQLLKYRKEPIVIYINTLLPFGAALAGKLMNKKVIYHIHESYIRPRLLKTFLKLIVRYTASKVIYVSNYLCQNEKVKGVSRKVIYNALPDEFILQTKNFVYTFEINSSHTVLMICSLKEYKGIYTFVSLASRHKYLNFELVLNASQSEINKFFNLGNMPNNLEIHPTQRDLDPFYRRAKLVVNLTNPKICIETFGMTILEAMSYGIPVIGPPIGGPTEIIESGKNGFLIDPNRSDDLDRTISFMFSQPNLMNQLSINAKITSKKFSINTFKDQVKSVFSEL